MRGVRACLTTEGGALNSGGETSPDRFRGVYLGTLHRGPLNQRSDTRLKESFRISTEVTN